jgi:hypothetical protein
MVITWIISSGRSSVGVGAGGRAPVAAEARQRCGVGIFPPRLVPPSVPAMVPARSTVSYSYPTKVFPRMVFLRSRNRGNTTVGMNRGVVSCCISFHGVGQAGQEHLRSLVSICKLPPKNQHWYPSSEHPRSPVHRQLLPHGDRNSFGPPIMSVVLGSKEGTNQR